MNNRFAAEDEQAAADDRERQNVWFEDAKSLVDHLKGERDALKDSAGTITNQALYDQLDGEFQAAEQERDRLNGVLVEFDQERQRQKDQQAENERLRKEAAEEEERRF